MSFSFGQLRAHDSCSTALFPATDEEIKSDIQKLVDQTAEEFPDDAFLSKNPSYVLSYMESWLANSTKIKRPELALKAVKQLIDYSEEHFEIFLDISSLLAKYIDNIWSASKALEKDRGTYQDALIFINMYPTVEGLTYLARSYEKLIDNPALSSSNQKLSDLIFHSDIESAVIRGGFELELYKPSALDNEIQKAQRAWNSIRFRYEAMLPEVQTVYPDTFADDESEFSTSSKISMYQAFSFHGQMSGNFQRIRLIINEIAEKFVSQAGLLSREVIDEDDQKKISEEFQDVFILFPRIQNALKSTRFKSTEHVPSLIYLDLVNNLLNTLTLNTSDEVVADLLDYFYSGYDRRMSSRFFEDFDAKYYPLLAMSFLWGNVLDWNFQNRSNLWAAKEDALIAKAKLAPQTVFELLLRLHPSHSIKDFCMKVLSNRHGSIGH